MGQLNSSLRRRHPLVSDPREIAQRACLREVCVCVCVWPRCDCQNWAEVQFPADGRRGRLLWKHKRSTQVLSPSSSPRGTPGWNERTVPSALVNGAPPSSSQADMLLSNGQSPLQLGPSSLELDQYSETVCLFGRTRCKMVSVLTFKHGWQKGLRLLWQDQEKCVRRGGSPSWKLEY